MKANNCRQPSLSSCSYPPRSATDNVISASSIDSIQHQLKTFSFQWSFHVLTLYWTS